MKVVKPLSTGDKGETPEFLSAQEITLSAPLSIAECRIIWSRRVFTQLYVQ